VKAKRAKGIATVPTTMGKEKAANPFLRADDPKLQAFVGHAGATVVKELAVASFGGVALKPGGMFLRLSGLKQPLAAGDQVALVLTTDGGVAMKVTAEVRRP